MPLGLKALKNVEEIVGEEMNNADAQEFLASAVIATAGILVSLLLKKKQTIAKE